MVRRLAQLRRKVPPMPTVNRFGQPIGDDLQGWEPPPFPPRQVITGETTRLEPLDWGAHGEALFEVLSPAPDSLWTYMAFGPFRAPHELKAIIDSMVKRPDWLPYAIVVGDMPLGFASYLRINPPEGVIEIGSIVLAPDLQRTTAATESIYLMIRNVFDLGYRRCEWKCDDLNAASRSAGERLGFRYEGTFRRATHYKGRNRDTAWFSMTDAEWPDARAALEAWLAPENFDGQGRRLRSLRELRATRIA